MRLRLVADDADPICAAAWARPRVRRHQVPALNIQQQSTAAESNSKQREGFRRYFLIFTKFREHFAYFNEISRDSVSFAKIFQTFPFSRPDILQP